MLLNVFSNVNKWTYGERYNVSVFISGQTSRLSCSPNGSILRKHMKQCKDIFKIKIFKKVISVIIPRWDISLNTLSWNSTLFSKQTIHIITVIAIFEVCVWSRCLEIIMLALICYQLWKLQISGIWLFLYN